MEQLVTFTQKEGGKQATDKAVGLLSQRGVMNPSEERLLKDNTARANDAGLKAERRVNKVMIPALTALSKGESVVTMRMTAKDDSVTMNINKLISTLKDPGQAEGLMGVKFDSDRAKKAAQDAVNSLEDLMKMPEGQERQQAAEKFMRGAYANDKFILGY